VRTLQKKREGKAIKKTKRFAPLHTSLQATFHSKHWSLKEYYFEYYGRRVSSLSFILHLPLVFCFFFAIYHFSPIIPLFSTFSLCCLSAVQMDGCFRLRRLLTGVCFAPPAPPFAPFIYMQAKSRLDECEGLKKISWISNTAHVLRGFLQFSQNTPIVELKWTEFWSETQMSLLRACYIPCPLHPASFGHYNSRLMCRRAWIVEKIIGYISGW
jgi:hypothetical protein